MHFCYGGEDSRDISYSNKSNQNGQSTSPPPCLRFEPRMGSVDIQYDLDILSGAFLSRREMFES